MRAVMSAANDLRAGEFQLVAAGGMESMSNAPYLAKGIRDGLRLGHGELIDSMIHDGLWDPYKNKHMGNCGETCAAHYGFTREEQDAYAIESYRRAQAAIAEGRFDDEIVKVEIPGKGSDGGRPGRRARPRQLRKNARPAPRLPERRRHHHRRQRQQAQRRRRRPDF